MTTPRILIIEDHKEFREAVHRFLELKNIKARVMEASSGEEGVLLARKVKPKVVITDFSLGGMNGLETAQQIIEHDPKCGIIMLTMFDPKEIARMGDKDGAVDVFISKSDLYDRLMPAIEGILDHPRRSP